MFDVDGDPLSFIVVQPEHGSLTEDTPGVWRYRPDADYNGLDQFQWTVSDGQIEVGSIARLTITAVNDAPLAQDISASVDEDGNVLINPLALAFDIDGDALTLLIDTQPAHGTLTLNADQSLSYSPDSDWSGEDSFTYHVNDGELNSQPATVRIVVNPIADTPILVLTDALASSRELFRTDWESTVNRNKTSTLLQQDYLEGWHLLRAPKTSSGGSNGFEIWSNGDQMMNQQGQLTNSQRRRRQW